MLISFSLIQFFKDILTFFHTKFTAVEGNMVVLCMAPFHICIEAMVCCTSLIFIFYALFWRLLSFTIFFHNTLSSILQVCMDKDFQTVCLILQNIISTSANDDAGALFCKLCNNPLLDTPEIIFIFKAIG